jgi:hypothetical protein
VVIFRWLTGSGCNCYPGALAAPRGYPAREQRQTRHARRCLSLPAMGRRTLRHATLHPWGAKQQRARMERARSELEAMRRTDERLVSLLPPSEELIQQRIFWVADAFGPTHVERLITGLRASDMDEGPGNQKPSDWVLQMRGGAYQSGRTHLNTIVPPDAKGFFQATRAELPTGVLLAIPTITVVQGTLTILGICFLLDHQSGLAVDEALRAEHRSEIVEVSERGTSFSMPMTQQRAAVTAARQQVRRSLTSWFTGHFEGAFGQQPESDLPTVELVTHRTDGAVKLSLGREWAWSLGFEGWPLWRSTKRPDIHMVESPDRESDPYVLRLRSRESAILPKQGPAGEALSEEQGWRPLVSELNGSIEGTAALWTAICLLRSYHSRLATMRDIPPSVGIAPKASERQLVRAQHQLAVASDARAIAADVARWTDVYAFAGYDGNDWKRVETVVGSPAQARSDVSWIGEALEWCPESAKRLLDSEERVRGRLLIEAQLLGAGAGLRVQRLALGIAVVALIVAIAALAVSAASGSVSHARSTATPLPHVRSAQ